MADLSTTLADCVLVPLIFNAQRFHCRLDHVPTVMRLRGLPRHGRPSRPPSPRPAPMPRPEPVPAPIPAAGRPTGCARSSPVARRRGDDHPRRRRRARAPWDSLNLRDEVGDDPLAVRENRARLHASIGRSSVLLAQVHGADVCTLEDLPPGAEQAQPAERVRADGCVTATSARACEIEVADCLPVLFADRRGAGGRRGPRRLARAGGGDAGATLARVCALAGAAPDEIECWLGPCIGPTHFEVDPEVVAPFSARRWRLSAARFHQPSPGGQGRSMLDLAALGRERLRRAGVMALGGNDSNLSWCTPQRSGAVFPPIATVPAPTHGHRWSGGPAITPEMQRLT